MVKHNFKIYYQYSFYFALFHKYTSFTFRLALVLESLVPVMYVIAWSSHIMSKFYLSLECVCILVKRSSHGMPHPVMIILMKMVDHLVSFASVLWSIWYVGRHSPQNPSIRLFYVWYVSLILVITQTLYGLH
eukprot:358375_1